MDDLEEIKDRIIALKGISLEIINYKSEIDVKLVSSLSFAKHCIWRIRIE